MADLSPHAQAVDQAAFQAWVTKDDPQKIAAATLRAAAAHVLTFKLKYLDGGPFDGGYNLGLQRAADELNGIANELESQ